MQRPPDFDTQPYGVDLPASWDRTVDDDAVVYENDRRTVRVSIREFSKNLSLYWWVDVHARPPSVEEWVRYEAGVGDSYRDPDRAAEAAQRVVDAVARGDGLAGVEPVASGGGPDSA